MGFFSALQFLTIIPAPFNRRTAVSLGPAAVDSFVLVGFALGLILVICDFLLNAVFPLSVASALLIAALVILTGGLHLDGFMDTCDGVFYPGEPERRLEIMRDSRVGAFGVVGLALLLLVKFSALSSLPPTTIRGFALALGSVPLRPAAILLMATASRLMMAYAVALFPYARPAGLGKMVQGGGKTGQLIIEALAVAALAYAMLGLQGLASLAASAIIAWSAAHYVMTKIPGLTGDVYGAIGELTEVVVILSLAVGR